MLNLFIATLLFSQNEAKVVVTDYYSGKSVVSELTAELGEMVVLDFSRSTRGSKPNSIKILIEPKERGDKAYISPDKNIACIPVGLKPIEIICTVVVAKEDVPDYTRIIIKCGQGNIPPPQPKPSPDPQPVPTNRNLFLIVVEESGFRNLDTAIVLNAIAFWNDLKLQRHDWVFYDKDTKEAYGQKIVQEVNSKNVKLPALVIKDLKTEQTLEIVPLPKTTKDIETLVKKYAK